MRRLRLERDGLRSLKEIGSSRFISIDEARKYSGFGISHVRKLVASGEWTCFKIGRNKLVVTKSISEWMERKVREQQNTLYVRGASR